MNKINLLKEKIPTENACFFVASDINRHYFTGFKSSAGTLLVCPNKSYLLIDFRYFEKACEVVSDSEVILLKNFKEQVCAILTAENCDKIYLEANTTSISDLNRYSKLFSDFEIVSDNILSDKIEEIRSVKSQAELSKMYKAQEIADAAFDYVCKNVIKVGATEKEIALALDFFMLSNGAEAISFETIALSGANTSLPHGVPSDKKVEFGDFVLMDFGAVYEGYHSDMTRTVAVGNATDEMKKIYNTVLTAQLKTLAAATSGISCKELDAVARNYIDEQGFGDNFGHGLGHSVGLEIHENPAANTRDETILKDKMIMTIEPGIYLPKKFGVRIEDIIEIAQNGYNNFTNSPKELIIL